MLTAITLSKVKAASSGHPESGPWNSPFRAGRAPKIVRVWVLVRSTCPAMLAQRLVGVLRTGHIGAAVMETFVRTAAVTIRSRVQGLRILLGGRLGHCRHWGCGRGEGVVCMWFATMQSMRLHRLHDGLTYVARRHS